MRGVYTAEIEAGVTAAKSLIHITVPADSVIEILSASITNSDIDATEQLEAGVYHVTTIGAPVGTAITPEKHETGDAASGVTAIGNLTTEPTTYNTIALDHQGFSNLNGYRYDPLPEERPIVSPSGAFGLRLLAAPDGATNLIAQVVYREIGG